MLQWSLAWILFVLAGMHVGVATTFSSADPWNPDNRLYCTNRPIHDDDLVAAHPTLPCGTRVLVWAPRTGRSTVVTVLDRGPRHAMIDLSPGAARALHSNGSERVVMLPLPEGD